MSDLCLLGKLCVASRAFVCGGGVGDLGWWSSVFWEFSTGAFGGVTTWGVLRGGVGAPFHANKRGWKPLSAVHTDPMPLCVLISYYTFGSDFPQKQQRLPFERCNSPLGDDGWGGSGREPE